MHLKVFLSCAILLTAILCPGQTSQGAPQIHIGPVPHPRALSEKPDTVEMIVIGDVMMHSKQLLHDHRTFLSNISGALSSADIAVANLEFPLGGKPYSGYPVFSTPDWYAEYLSDCGINVFLLANNHILDKGDPGVERSLSVYESMESRGRARYCGAGADSVSFARHNPLILEAGGMKIALVNFTYGTNIGSQQKWPSVSRMNKSSISEQFQRAREAGADFIVALPHWGEEYCINHSPAQEDLARWMISEGADAIVGSHPHVVQDFDIINGVPVFYSVGNAVSNMSIRHTRLEMAVTLRFTRDRRGEARLLPPEGRWMWCTLPGTLTDSYATIFTDEWIGRRDEWKDPSDYDNMLSHLNERHN